MNKVGQTLVTFECLGTYAVLVMLVGTVTNVLQNLFAINSPLLGLMVSITICLFAAIQTPVESRKGNSWIFLAILNAFLIYSAVFGAKT